MLIKKYKGNNKMNLGKLIRLFLVEGDLDGIVTAEIQNMTIYATSFPRTKLMYLRNVKRRKKLEHIFL